MLSDAPTTAMERGLNIASMDFLTALKSSKALIPDLDGRLAAGADGLHPAHGLRQLGLDKEFSGFELSLVEGRVLFLCPVAQLFRGNHRPPQQHPRHDGIA